MTTASSGPYRTAPFPQEEAWSDQDLTVPYEGQTRMRLIFAKGVSDLSLRVGATETALLRGHFDGLVPSVSVAGDEVSIRYPRFGIADWLGGVLWGEGVGATLVLHPGVAWELVFQGGASEVDVDFRHGRVTGLEISGGASEVDLTLPGPGRGRPAPHARRSERARHPAPRERPGRCAGARRRVVPRDRRPADSARPADRSHSSPAAGAWRRRGTTSSSRAAPASCASVRDATSVVV